MPKPSSTIYWIMFGGFFFTFVIVPVIAKVIFAINDIRINLLTIFHKIRKGE